MSINIKWPTEEGTKEASLPLSQLGGINGLKQQLLKHLGESSVGPGFMLTDTLKDITNDEDVARLRDGATLVVAQNKDGILAGPARERISFQPHPRTLTMAGDYEYFAAQVIARFNCASYCLHSFRKHALSPLLNILHLTSTSLRPTTGPTPLCLRLSRVH